jgi:hypothetical protein
MSTTAAKAAANRRNALASTGPRSADGKAVAARNATRHGLTAAATVLPHVETAADWEAHRAAAVASLAPAGYLEQELADRVALLLWRLRRVARAERESVALRQESVERDVEQAA